jgi:RNA polymerase sigma factor (sigma-70 family)
MGKLALRKIQLVVGRLDIAQELLQEVFVKLWQSRIQFETEGSLYTWIYRTSHNLAIDHVRSAVHRRESVAYDADKDLRASTCTIEDFKIDVESLRKACRSLTKQEAEIIVLLGVDEMTHDEAAQLLGISKKTVTRAVLRLREMVELKEVFHVR